jgi:hypothetical protein
MRDGMRQKQLQTSKPFFSFLLLGLQLAALHRLLSISFLSNELFSRLFQRRQLQQALLF